MLHRFRWLAVFLCSSLACAQLATVTPFGTGCYRQRRAFYELFSAPQPLDLAGTVATPGGMSLINTGSGFVALQLFNPWHTAGATAQTLQLSDDSLTPQLPLGFSMSFPTGSTTTIVVGSNGYIYPHGGTGIEFTPNAVQFLSGAARLCAMWMDLNPTGLSGITWETDPGTATAWLTFNAIPVFAGTATSTFQVALHGYGQIDLLYGPCARGSNQALLIGWSPGGLAADPGSMDLSASLPFLTNAVDSDPLSLSATGRPVIGTTMSLVVGTMPLGTQGAIVAFGAQQIAAGVDMAAFGMPGCRQYVGGLGDLAILPSAGPSVSLPVPVPNNAVLLGITAFVQAVASAPNRNQAQLIASNALSLLVGAQ